MKKLFPLVLAGALLLASCGYQVSDGSFGNNAAIPKITVRALENRTSETGLASLFSNDLAREFSWGKKSGEDNGAAVLWGSIVSLTESSASRQASGQARERYIYITLALTLKKAAGESLWQNRRFGESETYLVVENDDMATRVNRQAAMETISKRLAEKVRHEVGAHFSGF